MAEYISRETMIKLVRSMAENAETNGFMHDREVIECVMTTLVGVPLSDVAPVAHGKWKATGTFKVADYNYTVVEQRCSACGHCSIRFKNKAESNYCPKCGAKMDEEEHDNNV